MKKYLVTYVTDSGDLYHQFFNCVAEADKFVMDDIPDYNALIFTIDTDKAIECQDRT